MADDSPEWTLSAGDWRCTVSPFGASLRRLWLEPPGKLPRDVLWGYTGSANKQGGQGDVLAPWPGRIRDATYTFGGVRHALPPNDKDGPNAIHGFLRQRVWQGEVEGATARLHTRVRAADHAGYPFDLDVVVGYELLPSGLACAIVARNAGREPAPFGAGFHPYIATPRGAADAVLQVPASQVLPFDNLLPSGEPREVPPELDFRRARPVGDLHLNHCLTGLVPAADGFTRVFVDDVEVWMDPSFAYLVVYTGDALGAQARRAIAVEPMTCATDAFNHPTWGLRTLQPGEAMAATWGVALRH